MNKQGNYTSNYTENNKNIFASEKQRTDINFERLRKALIYIKNNLHYSDNKMYLTVD